MCVFLKPCTTSGFAAVAGELAGGALAVGGGWVPCHHLHLHPDHQGQTLSPGRDFLHVRYIVIFCMLGSHFLHVRYSVFHVIVLDVHECVCVCVRVCMRACVCVNNVHVGVRGDDNVISVLAL